eukprot:scaffold48_cov161-Amphora_coffeaeformis.AAC.16
MSNVRPPGTAREAFSRLSRDCSLLGVNDPKKILHPTAGLGQDYQKGTRFHTVPFQIGGPLLLLAHKHDNRKEQTHRKRLSIKFLHMGNKATKMSTPELSEDELTSGNDGKIYNLKKRRPGCTGMFWRPTPGKSLASNADWPRDGASLRGNVVTDSKGQAWLAATHVKQANGPWKRTPEGAAMPFEYDNHYYLEQAAKA